MHALGQPDLPSSSTWGVGLGGNGHLRGVSCVLAFVNHYRLSRAIIAVCYLGYSSVQS